MRRLVNLVLHFDLSSDDLDLPSVSMLYEKSETWAFIFSIKLQSILMRFCMQRERVGCMKLMEAEESIRSCPKKERNLSVSLSPTPTDDTL